jgi:4-hydroxy-2-oxoglutarate aldolase
MLLNGIFPAIATPFYGDGRLYLKKLEHNVERYSRGPVSGLVVLGSTGEAVMLSCEEQRQVLATAIAAAAAEKVMIAGCGHESVKETIESCELAAQFGYDVAMVRTPHYFRAQMSSPAMLNYFRTVADRSPLPILLYNIPQCTGYDLAAELIADLAGHANIVGIKESSGSLAKVERVVQRTRQVRRDATVTHEFQPVTRRMLQRAGLPQQQQTNCSSASAGGLVSASELAKSTQPTVAAPPVSASAAGQPSSAAVELVGELRIRRKQVGFQILVGSGHMLHVLLNAGAVGGVLAFAACAPTACYEIYAAFKDGDHTLAAEKQRRMEAACIRIAGELGIAGVKHAADLNGYYGGQPRLPLLPLTAAQRQEVERLMAEIKN